MTPTTTSNLTGTLPPALTGTLTPWIWRHLHLQLPEDWELLRFSRKPEQGECLFADREMFRLELNWKQVEGTPDFDRMLKDYQERLVFEHEMERPVRSRHNDWHGLSGQLPEYYASRYGRYLESLASVIELVFLWDDEPDAKLERRILDSLRHVPEDEAGRQLWKACGIECRPAADLQLDTCTIQPASLSMTFATPEPKCMRMEHFERLGLVDYWLITPLREWLASKLPKETRNVRQTHKSVQNHTVEIITGEIPAGFPKLTAKPFKFHACCWQCPADRHVYVATAIDQKAPSIDEMIGTRLRCCCDMPVTAGAAA